MRIPGNPSRVHSGQMLHIRVVVKEFFLLVITFFLKKGVDLFVCKLNNGLKWNKLVVNGLKVEQKGMVG
jgi:hypothetical protein